MPYINYMKKETGISGVKMCPKMEKSAQDPGEIDGPRSSPMANSPPPPYRLPGLGWLLEVIQSRGIKFRGFNENQEKP